MNPQRFPSIAGNTDLHLRAQTVEPRHYVLYNDFSGKRMENTQWTQAKAFYKHPGGYIDILNHPGLSGLCPISFTWLDGHAFCSVD